MSSPAPERSHAEGLELIEAFVNTLHMDIGLREEAIPDPAALATWIREQARIEVGELTAAEHERAIALREALRGLLLAHNGVEVEPEVLAPLRRAAEAARFGIRIGAGGELGLVPIAAGLAAFEARLMLAIAEAQALGSWERLKACQAEECHWAFYDRSRNRSRTWCSMETCGNRTKTRRYRRALRRQSGG